MTKVAVISDSHWGSVHVNMFAATAEKEHFDAIIHCGDGLSDAKQIEKKLGVEVIKVAGNCDPSFSADREKRVTIGNVPMLVVHGDRYSVKIDPSGLSYYAEEIGAKVVLFGHTHRSFTGYVGRTLMVNPGALKSGSYAELHIENGQVEPYIRSLYD